MKRITTLLLAVAMVVGSISIAKADGVDVKVNGQWDFAFVWRNSNQFNNIRHGSNSSERDQDAFIARQRIRTQINFIISEALQGVLFFEIGNTTWGRGGATGSAGGGEGGRMDADGVNIKTRRAYIDWIIPNTEVAVRMGIQSLALPNAMGSPVFHTDVAGVLVSSPITENVGIAAFWIRPFDRFDWDYDSASDFDRSIDDEVDAFGLLLPIKGQGWSVTPWGVFARVGNASGIYEYIFGLSGPDTRLQTTRYEATTASAWWAGLNFELTMFDPLTFKMDAMYGKLNRNDLTHLNGGTRLDVGTKGWFIAAALDYSLDWGTPGIFGWYSSGDDYDDFVDDGYLGRIPVVGTDQGFQPTSFGFPGSYSNGIDTVISATGAGTWGLGIQLADFSFVDDLKHTLRLAYYRGTNDKDMAREFSDTFGYTGVNGDMYLTKGDYVWEVNFDHQYKIYENLTAVLELGYLRLHADDGVWRTRNNNRGDGFDSSENAWRAQLIFSYKF